MACPDLTCPNLTCTDQACPDLTCLDLTCPDLTFPNLTCPELKNTSRHSLGSLRTPSRSLLDTFIPDSFLSRHLPEARGPHDTFQTLSKHLPDIISNNLRKFLDTQEKLSNSDLGQKSYFLVQLARLQDFKQS